MARLLDAIANLFQSYLSALITICFSLLFADFNGLLSMENVFSFIFVIGAQKLFSSEARLWSIKSFVACWPCSLAVSKDFATSGSSNRPVVILSKGTFSVFSGSNIPKG